MKTFAWGLGALVSLLGSACVVVIVAHAALVRWWSPGYGLVILEAIARMVLGAAIVFSVLAVIVSLGIAVEEYIKDSQPKDEEQ